MSTPLTDSINALTRYANETTGASDTTLSDAVGSLVAGYGGGSQVATGTFTADGSTSDASMNVGFEPDMVSIKCNLDYYTTGWAGMGNIIIVKNVLTAHARHNTTSVNGIQSSINASFDESHPYGLSTTSYGTYGTYSNGIFTVTNNTKNAITRFVSGVTYTWAAVKYS